MTDTSWLTDSWPWFLMAFFLVVYEVYALVTKKGRTLSRMVWNGAKKYPWSVPIVLSILAWLIPHFYITHGEWAIELPLTGVIVAMIWMAFIAIRKRVPNGNA